MTNRQLVFRNLAHLFLLDQIIHGSISGEDSEVNNFGVRVRVNTPCALVLANFEANDRTTSEKIALVSDKIKDGVLLLFRFGVYSKGSLVTFKTKTVIVTGIFSNLYSVNLVSRLFSEYNIS